MPGADLTDLDARFSRLSEEYSPRRSAAHDAVVRWDWFDGDAFDLRPLHYLRDLRRPGSRLAARPPLDDDCLRIGFDAADRPVAFLEYSGFLHGKLYYETYRDHTAGPGLVQETHFYADGRPIYLHEYHFEDGLIRSATMVANGGGSHETYSYAGRHVTRIVHRYARATGKPDPRLFPLAPWEEFVATYDDTGLLRLASQPSGEVRYERPPSGFTIDAACALVRRSLVTQIPAVVADLPVDGPACCVSLTYSSSHPLDVMLCVVSAEERKSLIAEYTGNRTIVDGRPWIGDFWTFGDEPGEEPVDLSTVADTVRLLTQELSLAADDRGRRLLCAVAAELNTHDWSRVLPVTDDFVVYAVDLEMADLERNLPACLPPARAALLRDRGLL